MAKRVVKWLLDGCILKLAKPLEDPKSEAVIEALFDVSLLFANFNEMNDVQKQLVIYATKQKLMDSGASEIANFDGKVKAAKDKFQELLDGKWTGDRVNATGAAENKKLIATVKEASKVISLEGLVMKKMLYADTFTEEDEAKLQEFLVVAAKAGKKK